MYTNELEFHLLRIHPCTTESPKACISVINSSSKVSFRISNILILHLSPEGYKHLFFLPGKHSSKPKIPATSLQSAPSSASSKNRVDSSMQVLIFLLFSIPPVRSLQMPPWSSESNGIYDPRSAATRSLLGLFFFLFEFASSFEVIHGGWTSSLQRVRMEKTRENWAQMNEVLVFIVWGQCERFWKFRDLVAKSELGIKGSVKSVSERIKVNSG